MLLLIYIKQNLIKGHVETIETIGNLRTEGHGLMLNDPAQPIKTISEHTNNTSIIGSLSANPITTKNSEMNKFCLKIRPKASISFN